MGFFPGRGVLLPGHQNKTGIKGFNPVFFCCFPEERGRQLGKCGRMLSYQLTATTQHCNVDQKCQCKIKRRVTEPGKVSARVTEPGKVSARVTEPGKVSVRVTEPGKVSARVTEPGKVSARITEPGKVRARVTEVFFF